jgi:hypothetical protein
MEYRFEFGGSPQDVKVVAAGVASVSGFGRLYESLCDQSQFQRGMLILLDLTEVDMSAIPLSEAPEIGRGLAGLRGRCEGCGLAVVCRDPLTTVLTRAGLEGAADWIDVWVASTRDEASSWLESQVSLRAQHR